MKINHLNLVVTDVAKAIAFFENHLGFTCIENRKDAVGVLTGEDNFVLIFWSSKLNKTHEVSYPENFHIGFYQEDQEAVNRIHAQLTNAGVALESEPRKIRNTYGFYFYFDQILIEISVLPAL